MQTFSQMLLFVALACCRLRARSWERCTHGWPIRWRSVVPARSRRYEEIAAIGSYFAGQR